MNRLSIKSQVMLLTILSLILLASTTTFLSSSKSKDALMKSSYERLSTVRDMKKNQIQGFFNRAIMDINVLAMSKNLQDISWDLLTVLEDLEVEANAPFPVNNPSAKEERIPHEPFFQKYLKDYGYYDIFVIGAEYGHVMYTATKESDYGANLSSGSLRNSGLGEAYRKAKELKRTVFIDMKPYAPSNNEPAMFIATPVIVNAKIQAILVFQISDKSINKIMQFRKGYGDTQEDYLIGADKLMRSDSFLSKDTHTIKASFMNSSTGSIDTVATRAALSGKTGIIMATEYTKQQVLLSYSFIEIGEDFNWAIVSRMDEAEVLLNP